MAFYVLFRLKWFNSHTVEATWNLLHFDFQDSYEFVSSSLSGMTSRKYNFILHEMKWVFFSRGYILCKDPLNCQEVKYPLNYPIQRQSILLVRNFLIINDVLFIKQSPSRMRSGLEARRTISGGMSEFSRRGGLKQPPTVVAQFQVSAKFSIIFSVYFCVNLHGNKALHYTLNNEEKTNTISNQLTRKANFWSIKCLFLNSP